VKLPESLGKPGPWPGFSAGWRRKHGRKFIVADEPNNDGTFGRYREPLNAWLRTATIPGHIIVAVMLMFLFSGYARSTLIAPAAAAAAIAGQGAHAADLDVHDDGVLAAHLTGLTALHARLSIHQRKVQLQFLCQ
jgi:hypothetical protein